MSTVLNAARVVSLSLNTGFTQMSHCPVMLCHVATSRGYNRIHFLYSRHEEKGQRNILLWTQPYSSCHNSAPLTLANCLRRELGSCEVVTTIFGSSTPAQTYSSSMWVAAARSEGKRKWGGMSGMQLIDQPSSFFSLELSLSMKAKIAPDVRCTIWTLHKLQKFGMGGFKI